MSSKQKQETYSKNKGQKRVVLVAIVAYHIYSLYETNKNFGDCFTALLHAVMENSQITTTASRIFLSAALSVSFASGIFWLASRKDVGHSPANKYEEPSSAVSSDSDAKSKAGKKYVYR